MASFSGLAIGLSLLFGFVLIASIVEVCYLLWWKKKREDIENQDSSSSNYYSKCITHLSCFKNTNPSSNHQEDLQTCEDEINNLDKEQEPTSKDLPTKGFGEESLDLELMRLHNLCGPPRFLFTINEETKEDLELASKKSGSRSMSLSELLCQPETPISSPSPLKTSNLEGYLNPLFDYYEANEFDINKIRSSPPPTFKFLRDAEEKLLKRLMQLKKNQDAMEDCSMKIEEKGKAKSEGKIHYHHHQMSTPSQVLPLASSPSS
ncbi:uncharacterized protein LOC143530022 [Bidens hawaiensis]|uniref:uncharacterized protein LOC143530022 n=1 Tax=Bidens hawaiensis TaxID=980011 RepID=UPI0040498F7A